MNKPVLAFAHANGVPGGSYKRFLRGFEEQYDLCVIDRLGCDHWPVGDNWAGLVDELEARLSPLPKPIVGMGHSMGAVVMFMVASRHPDWFSELVMLDPPLINGWVRPLVQLAYTFGQMDRVTPAGKSRGRRDNWPSWQEVEKYFTGRGMFKYFDPQSLQDYMHAAVEERDGAWWLRIAPSLEVEMFRQTPRNINRFARLAIPSLLVNGDITLEGFKSAARRHVKRHRMTHALAPGSHMFPLENPDQTAGVIKSWLQIQEQQVA